MVKHQSYKEKTLLLGTCGVMQRVLTNQTQNWVLSRDMQALDAPEYIPIGSCIGYNEDTDDTIQNYQFRSYM